jgi:menaquinone-9 beta-reductase
VDNCDVLIVGGGPAGASCAWALRDSGLDVIVMDRATFPRDKLCGGWVTPLVFRELEIDLAEYLRGRTLQPITGFHVSAIGQHAVEVECGEVVSYGIRRCEFDEYLLRRCGARVLEGKSVQSFRRIPDGWLVNGEIRARILVGAGGHFCPLARSMGDGSKRAVVAQEIEFQMSPREESRCAIRSEVPELFFCRDLAGYAWCFRKGTFLNIGLGRLDHSKLPDHLRNFVQHLQDSDKINLDLPPRFSGHAYLLFGNSSRRIVDDSVLLVGDSAGLAFPESGEGIRPAIESGFLAARVIIAADHVYSMDRLSEYPQLLHDRFSRPSNAAERVAKRLPPPVKSVAGRLLLRNPAFCRKVVADWFLRSSDQPLQPLKARYSQVA